jgi:hypothetical protein
MTRRAIVTFRRYSDPTQEKRLFIRDGVVMNPQVEVDVKADEDWNVHSLRRTGEGKRILEYEPTEEVQE